MKEIKPIDPNVGKLFKAMGPDAVASLWGLPIMVHQDGTLGHRLQTSSLTYAQHQQVKKELKKLGYTVTADYSERHPVERYGIGAKDFVLALWFKE